MPSGDPKHYATVEGRQLAVDAETTTTEDIDVSRTGGRMHYCVVRTASDSYLVVNRNLAVETEETEAGAAIQFAYDNAPAVAAIGLHSAGKNNPYRFETTVNINADATSIVGMPRHGVQLEPDPNNPPSESFLVDTNASASCNVFYGLKFQGNNGSWHGVRSLKHTKNLRFINCHSGPDVGGYVIKDESSSVGILLCGQGTYRSSGQAGDVYTTNDCYVAPLIDGADVDGGGNKIGFQTIPNRRVDVFGEVDFHNTRFGDNSELLQEGTSMIKLDGDAGPSGLTTIQQGMQAQQFMRLRPQSSDPGYNFSGNMAVQDGTNWDPAGTGQEELLCYLNGSWVQVS